MKLVKIFAVSDIHGHYALLKKALEEAGFEIGNDEHLLVVIGDCFDRGCENKAVFDFLRSIDNKVIVRGNHEDFLIDILDNGAYDSFYVRNGTDITVCQLFGDENVDSYGRITQGCPVEDEIREFVGGMCDYFETRNYVFTHGWVPVWYNGGSITPLDDWRVAQNKTWEHARFLEWPKMYQGGAMLKGKTVVCGHRATFLASNFDTKRGGRDFSIYKAEGLVAIDACTVLSHQVNVFVTEDIIPTRSTHKMGLIRDMFEEVKYGDKTIEMRMFDRKRKKIKVGDMIEFHNEDYPDRTVTCEVIGLYRYPDFETLLSEFSEKEVGFPRLPKTAISRVMNKIYAYESFDDGVLAIRIKKN